MKHFVFLTAQQREKSVLVDLIHEYNNKIQHFYIPAGLLNS